LADLILVTFQRSIGMNLFKRTAKAVGRFFNFRHRTTEQLLIDQEPTQQVDPIERINELDASIDPVLASELTPSDDIEPSLEEAIDRVSSELLSLDPDRINTEAADQSTGEAVTASVNDEPITYSAEPAKMVEAVFAPAPAGPAVDDLSTMDIEQVRPVIQHKPEPSITELYEMISGDLSRRGDKAVEVYERLLAATRQELESARKSNKFAWSVGGVMTAVAALGGIWSATQIGATRNEVGALKHQVSAAQQTSIERQRVTDELLKISQTTAKIEIEAIKSRLDQAISVSAERDRLRVELAISERTRINLQSELKTAQSQAQTASQKVAATPSTQPVSAARLLSDKPVADATQLDRTDNAVSAAHAVGAERPDVWSALLNGR
jgi:hypothetical protein